MLKRNFMLAHLAIGVVSLTYAKADAGGSGGKAAGASPDDRIAELEALLVSETERGNGLETELGLAVERADASDGLLSNIKALDVVVINPDGTVEAVEVPDLKSDDPDDGCEGSGMSDSAHAVAAKLREAFDGENFDAVMVAEAFVSAAGAERYTRNNELQGIKRAFEVSQVAIRSLQARLDERHERRTAANRAANRNEEAAQEAVDQAG